MLLKNESRRFEDPCLLASLVCLGPNSVPLSLLSLDSFQKSILLFLKIRFLVTISDLSSVKYARCVTQRMRKIRLPTSVEARKGTLKKLCLINMQKNYSVQQIDALNVPMACFGKYRFCFNPKKNFKTKFFSL